MPETERVTIRLPPEVIKKLDGLVESGEYKNKSNAIRAAIDVFLESRVSPPNIEKMIVDIPSANIEKLEELVAAGDSISVNDAVRDAVREYTRSRFETMIEEYEKIKRMREMKEDEE